MAVDGGMSVIMITRGRPALLRACLKSVIAGGGPPEIIAGVNGEDPESLAVIKSFKDTVRAVNLRRMCRGEARNALVSAARGRWLCFLDDDTVVPEGYFTRLAALIEKNPDCSVFGGGQELYAGAGYFEAAVYALLSSRWGGGPFTERFSPVRGTRPAGPEKFILCNLIVDRKFLTEHALSFEGHLTSAEENLLMNRMAAAGAGMILSGDLNLVHRRRSGLPDFLAQVFSSGRGRAQITLLSRDGFSAFTLLPPAALFLGGFSAAVFPSGFVPLAAAYGAACAAAAFSGPGWKIKASLIPLFPALHSAYAAGWLYGAVEFMAEKVFRRRKPLRCRCEGIL